MGGFVDYDPAERTYSLPPEHAAILTRAARHENFAVFAQYYPLIGPGASGGACPRRRSGRSVCLRA